MMVATAVSVLLAILLIVLDQGHHEAVEPLGSIFLASAPLVLLASYLFIYSRMLTPLQKSEQETTPRILEMFHKDPIFGYLHLGILFTLFVAMVGGIASSRLLFLPFFQVIGAWLLLIGAAIDMQIYFLRRILGYLNPFRVTQFLREAAVRSIQNDKEEDLCEWIDALTEIGRRSLEGGGSTLCNETINELREVTRLFLEASKSISHTSEDEQLAALGIKDKVAFTLFYLYQRLEMVFEKALEKKLEPVCSNILTAFGKITLQAANYDISLSTFSLQQIGILSLQAQQQKLQNISLKATCIYGELAKAILTESPIAYTQIKDPFFTIIHYMDRLAKETFKQNKEVPIRVLLQPFYDLKEQFQPEKIALHPDSAAIVGDIDRVIAEFDTLDMVLKTMPPLASFTKLAGEEEEPASKPEELKAPEEPKEPAQ